MSIEIVSSSKLVQKGPNNHENSPLATKCSAAFQAKKMTSRDAKELKEVFSQIKEDDLLDVLDTFFENVFKFEEKQKEANFEKELEETLDSIEAFFTMPDYKGDCIDEEKTLRFMQKFVELIPLEKLQAAVKSRYPNSKDALLEAGGLLRNARIYLEKLENNHSPTISARLHSLLAHVLAFIDSIVAAFGVADFFKAAEGQFESDFKFQKIFMILSLFTFLTATLLPMFGVTTASSIVGGTLLGIAVLSLIWPKVRPVVQHVPKGKNWSEEYREGKLEALGGRKKLQDKVARMLVANKEVKTVKEHILITGPSGIGKTEFVKNLVEAIVKGEYPELKGLEVLYFNTADIVSNRELFSGENKILQKICEAIKARNSNVIIILDEIHKACELKENSAIGDQLKTVLDSDFPNVIAMTTEEEFVKDIYENQSAFFRRFTPESLRSTDKKETKIILQNFFLKNALPGLVMDDLAYDEIINQTENEPQPLAALKVLSRCIRKTAKTQKTLLDEQISDKLSEVREMDLKGAVVSFSEDGVSVDTLLETKKEFQDLVYLWKEEKRKMGHLMNLRDFYASVRTAVFQSVEKVARIRNESLKSNKTKQRQVKEFVFMRYFLGPALEKNMREQAVLNKKTNTKAKILIDNELVTEVLKEKEAIKAAVEETVKTGRESLKSRRDKT